MPIYQYKCTYCEHQMEALQKMSDAPLSDCPECENATLKKQVTAAAFRLKGSGWYETDFKNSGKPANDKSSSGSNNKGDTASDSVSTSSATSQSKASAAAD